jgi:Domain of unknown function (DUF5618)
LLLSKEVYERMGSIEQEKIKIEYFTRAVQKMDEAQEILNKAKREDDFYKYKKPVKKACILAYRAVKIALDAYFLASGVKLPKSRKSINYYRANISKLNSKLSPYLEGVHTVLYLDCYCDGLTCVDLINIGIKTANTFIEKIKPVE